MKQELKKAIENMKKYNSGVMYKEVFGFPSDIFYDALVVAPGWKPTKIIKDPSFKVTELVQHAYFSSFLVEKDGYKIAWAQTASGGCNLLDNLIICSEMKFKKCIFIGAVGGLSENFEIGDFCTPVECISGVYASHYFDSKLPFITMLYTDGSMNANSSFENLYTYKLFPQYGEGKLYEPPKSHRSKSRKSKNNGDKKSSN